MGLYDREYYRDEPARGFQLGLSHSVVVNVIVINVVIYLIDTLFQVGLASMMALHADLLDRPWNVWQLLTCGFAHAPDPWHVLFNMLALWFFGRDVEAIYGSKLFLRLYLSLIVCASLAWVVSTNMTVDRPYWGYFTMVGASGGIAGILAIFVCHYPTRTILLNFFIPVPAWVMGLIWLGSDIAGALNRVQGDNVAYAAHLGGAAFGFLFYKTHWYLGWFVPDKWSMPSFKKKPPLRVHRPSEPREADVSEEADAILEKIGRHGQDSLTAHERRVLEEYSRRMQQKRR
jgi:membrane associated rhomboid family serine protease